MALARLLACSRRYFSCSRISAPSEDIKKCTCSDLSFCRRICQRCGAWGFHQVHSMGQEFSICICSADDDWCLQKILVLFHFCRFRGRFLAFCFTNSVTGTIKIMAPVRRGATSMSTYGSPNIFVLPFLQCHERQNSRTPWRLIGWQRFGSLSSAHCVEVILSYVLHRWRGAPRRI